MWSVIHKISTRGKKSSVIMTTHSMDEAETLCKRLAIMVNGEFVCLGESNEIKDNYGYGFECDVRIKPLSEEEFDKMLETYELKKDVKITRKNIKGALTRAKKEAFIDELHRNRLGAKIVRDIDMKGSITMHALLSWCYYLENALKFIKTGHNYFEEVIMTEFIENNFLFKMKKGPKTKSIGFFFGLFEKSKEPCHVTEYSIQQTSLEQIFNKFAANQKKSIEEGGQAVNGALNQEDNENKQEENKKIEIIMNNELYDKLLK